MLEKVKGKFIILLFPKTIITPFSKEKLLSTDMVTTSEEVDKDTRKLYDNKEAGVRTTF